MPDFVGFRPLKLTLIAKYIKQLRGVFTRESQSGAITAHTSARGAKKAQRARPEAQRDAVNQRERGREREIGRERGRGSNRHTGLREQKTEERKREGGEWETDRRDREAEEPKRRHERSVRGRYPRPRREQKQQIADPALLLLHRQHSGSPEPL